MSKKIAVIGGIDHGRTTFIAAIKNVLEGEFTHPSDIDGMDSRFSAKVNYCGEKYEFFDFPQTEDYAENLDGTEDAAVWVIDACEGPLSGARDQLCICIEKGIENYALFINKRDLVDDDDLMEICECEIKEVFDEEGIFGDEIPTVWGSSKKALWDPDTEWGDPIRIIVDKVLDIF